MALSYNLGYQESISVHPTRRQNFAGKVYSNFPNIWEWVVYVWKWQVSSHWFVLVKLRHIFCLVRILLKDTSWTNPFPQLHFSAVMDTGHCCFLWCKKTTNKTTRNQNNNPLPPYSQRLSHVIVAKSNLAIRHFPTKGDFLQVCEGLLPPLLGFPRVENELKTTFDQRWNYQCHWIWWWS